MCSAVTSLYPEKLPRRSYGVQVQHRQQPPRAVPAPDGQHPLDGRIEKCVHYIAGTLRIGCGKVAISVYIIAARIERGFKSQGLDRIGRRLQPFLWHC